MQPYQEEYLNNCRAVASLTAWDFVHADSLDDALRAALEGQGQVAALSRRNTQLLETGLLPVLDALYSQEKGVLLELEEFADALSVGARPLDLGLAEQVFSALLSVSRHREHTGLTVRLLYKLGMVRYQTWNMFTGVSDSQVQHFSTRMRYCFIEASSYLKYYEEFDSDTLSYVLRSLANTYLGGFGDWRERMDVVRHSMQVFTDERYRAAAPDLPWGSYMNSLHRQMVALFPRSLPDQTLSPDAVEDVMESAHLLYELQYEEAEKNGQPIDAHWLIPYYCIECSCGIITPVELITHMETMMDEADPTRYDTAANYRIISMPAFYVQYLRQMPKEAAERKDYITQLYRRMLSYLLSMPVGEIRQETLLYMRQNLSMFMEIEGGLSYLDLAEALTRWVAPELYAHGFAVGRMAQAIGSAILDGEPDFFDDIPEVEEAGSIEEKRETVSRLLFCAGLLHDIGKLSFTAIGRNVGRPMLSSEEEALRYHAEIGHLRLEHYPSTQVFSAVAWGHHRWYDGSDGYPASYRRQEHDTRALVDLIALANFLDSNGDNDTGLPVRTEPFSKKLQTVNALQGRRFSPMAAAWLHSPELTAALEDIYLNGRREGLYHCFRRRDDRKPSPETGA